MTRLLRLQCHPVTQLPAFNLCNYLYIYQSYNFMLSLSHAKKIIYLFLIFINNVFELFFELVKFYNFLYFGHLKGYSSEGRVRSHQTQLCLSFCRIFL